MEYKLYSKVKVITNKYEEKGVFCGAIGIILEKYKTGDYEVQFLDKENEFTDIFFSVNKDDIIALRPEDK